MLSQNGKTSQKQKGFLQNCKDVKLRRINKPAHPFEVWQSNAATDC